MLFFRGENVQIIRRSYKETYDDFGVQEEVLTLVEAEAVVGFRTTKTDIKVQAVVEDTEMRLFFPEGTLIFPDDTFVVRGSFWEKDGSSIELNRSPFSTPLIHSLPVIVEIKQVKGNAHQAWVEALNSGEESNG